MSILSKKLTGTVLAGFMVAAGSAFAAENAAGVAEHMKMTIKVTKDALDGAKSGNEAACLANIKQAKQHYKEITGDAAGKPLQDAMKRMKDAQAECEAGNSAKGAEILTEVVASMEKIQSGIR